MTEQFRHFRHFRHMSIRTRLALGVLVPLGMATSAVGVAVGADAGNPALLSGALMLASIGTGLAMLQVNARALCQPLDEARLATRALARGDYARRTRITRMDETGQLLAELDELGNYLAVMLPEETGTGPETKPPSFGTPHRARPVPASPMALERIVERLREGDDFGSVDHGQDHDRPAPSVSRPAASTSQPHLASNQA